jgi:cation:H+ antiporter
VLTFLWIIALLAGVGAIVWGAEAFAEHLGKASVALGVSSFALALLLAGAEPEELATAVVASLRGSPGVALGDVIGANVTICLIALGVGAWIAPLPFSGSALRYALLGVPLGVIGTWFAWDGKVSRPEGAILVALYVAYVTLIWIIERHPPTLGEVGELAESQGHRNAPRRAGRDLVFVLLGITAMAGGASLLVEAVRRISHIESTQTTLGLTVVGFATGFELVVLAWSASRRGASEAVVAGVVGSFAYNVTMTLGAAALAHPLVLQDVHQLHIPLLAMLASLILVIGLAGPRKVLIRTNAVVLYHRPAVASDVWHSLHQLHACEARPMSLLPVRAEPTIRKQSLRREQRQKQHLYSPSSVRTQQSRKAVAIGERQCGKNNRSLPSIPRSSQFESQANCHGFGRWL